MQRSAATQKPPNHLRRATLVAALLLAALALLTWWRRPAPAVPVAPPAPALARPPSTPVRAPRPSPPEPAPVTEEEAARYAAAREALDAVAAVTGRTVVSCPYPNLGGGGFGGHNDSVSLWGGPGVVLMATPEPAGALMFRSEDFDRATGMTTEGPPVGVLGWSTLPDGTVACSWTEADHVPMRVRVVDEDGVPLTEGHVWSVDATLMATTGPDGWATLAAWSRDPVRVHGWANGTSLSEPAMATADAETTLVVARNPPGGPEGFPDIPAWRAEQTRLAHQAVLDTLDETPGLSPAAVNELLGQTDSFEFALELAGEVVPDDP